MDAPTDAPPDPEAEEPAPTADETSGPVAVDDDRIPRRVKLGWFAGIAAGLIGLGTFQVVTSAADSPKAVVTAFFAAITDRDVETALTYVEPSAIPTGAPARFLTPAAISGGWRVTSVKDVGSPSGFSAERDVDVTIGGPHGTASGTFTLSEDEQNGWLLESPFAPVVFPASPLRYPQVNGYVPKPQAVGNANVGTRYELFPGMYTFFEDIPDVLSVKASKTLAVFPPGEDAKYDAATPHPGRVTAKPDTLTAANAEIRTLIDTCAEQTVAQPSGCPFGVGEFVNTTDGEHVEDLHGLSWKVDEYPKSALSDARFETDHDGGEPNTGFRVLATSAGSVTLKGTGVDTDDKTTKFTIRCRIDLDGVSATVDHKGVVKLSTLAASTAGEPTDDSCGKKESK